jgi:hypothetical protein
MIQKHAKKAKEKAAEVAKRTAQEVGSELASIPKQATKEAVGLDSRPSPVVEAMQMQTDPNTLKDEGSEGPKKKLDYLEKEMEALKQRQEYLKQKEEVQAKEEQKDEPQEVFVEAPAKPKRGLFGRDKKKTKGTGEIIRSKK